MTATPHSEDGPSPVGARAPSPIDEYIDARPPEAQAVLREICDAIRLAVPGATEAISYQIPTFKLNNKNLIHVGAWKKHVGLYPIPAGPPSFEKLLSKYETSKGTVRLPYGKPVPGELIERMVELRKGEVLPR